jgi:hypothetical protein
VARRRHCSVAGKTRWRRARVGESERERERVVCGGALEAGGGGHLL